MSREKRIRKKRGKPSRQLKHRGARKGSNSPLCWGEKRKSLKSGGEREGSGRLKDEKAKKPHTNTKKIEAGEKKRGYMDRGEGWARFKNNRLQGALIRFSTGERGG